MKWSEVLRSGNYEQARGTLYNGVGYCCLGVLEHACGVEFLNLNNSDFEDAYGESSLPGWEFLEAVGAEHLDEALTPEDKVAIDVILDQAGYPDYERGCMLDALETEEDASDEDDVSKVKDALALLNDKHANFEIIAQVIEDRGWDVEVTHA